MDTDNERQTTPTPRLSKPLPAGLQWLAEETQDPATTEHILTIRCRSSVLPALKRALSAGPEIDPTGPSVHQVLRSVIEGPIAQERDRLKAALQAIANLIGIHQQGDLLNTHPDLIDAIARQVEAALATANTRHTPRIPSSHDEKLLEDLRATQETNRGLKANLDSLEAEVTRLRFHHEEARSETDRLKAALQTIANLIGRARQHRAHLTDLQDIAETYAVHVNAMIPHLEATIGVGCIPSHHNGDAPKLEHGEPGIE